MSHKLELEFPPTKPVENVYSDIPTIPSQEVKIQEEIELGISKVKVGDEIYCSKSVHRKLDTTSFKREIDILRASTHPNIVHLKYLVTIDGMIEAMLLQYVENARVMVDVKEVSASQFTRWTTELLNTISYLHEKKLVWGDVKPGNVLIREDNSIVLIDFGGGFTEGWVDYAKCGTIEGDLEGYHKIVEFLREKIM